MRIKPFLRTNEQTDRSQDNHIFLSDFSKYSQHSQCTTPGLDPLLFCSRSVPRGSVARLFLDFSIKRWMVVSICRWFEWRCLQDVDLTWPNLTLLPIVCTILRKGKSYIQTWHLPWLGNMNVILFQCPGLPCWTHWNMMSWCSTWKIHDLPFIGHHAHDALRPVQLKGFLGAANLMAGLKISYIIYDI